MGLVINKEVRKAGDVTLYPYKDVEQFPEYAEDDGKMYKLPEQWREVGFVVPRVTLARAEHMDKQGRIMRQGKNPDGTRFTYPDVEMSRLVAYYTTGGFIKDWVGVVDDNGDPVEFDAAARQWLKEEFNQKGWLFAKLHNEWQSMVKAAEEERKVEDANFTEE